MADIKTQITMPGQVVDGLEGFRAAYKARRLANITKHDALVVVLNWALTYDGPGRPAPALNALDADEI